MNEAMTIEVSLRTAGLATVTLAPLATPIGLWLARRRQGIALVVEAVVMAPLVVPPVVVGLGLSWLIGPLGPPDGSGRLVATVMAGAIVGLPLFVRAVRLQRESVDDRLLHAARSLGASPLRTFAWITLPHVWPGIVLGAILAFARALGEYGATLLFAGPGPTLPFAIAQAEAPLEDPTILKLGLLSFGVSMSAVLAFQLLTRRAL
ncbi:MAG: ABC transporter permease subunit [Myxococcota bacterium]